MPMITWSLLSGMSWSGRTKRGRDLSAKGPVPFLSGRSCRQRSGSRPRCRDFRPRAEVLEDRTLLSILVTNPSDLAGQTGTLRDAVAMANADAAAGRSNTITFAANLAGATITLAQGQLELSGAGGGTITIDGSGLSSPVTISGNNASRVFLVDARVQAVLNDLVITDGNSGFLGGGGISNSGTLTLSGDTVSGNISSGADGGGGIYNGVAFTSPVTLTVSNSTIAGNTATQGGGGGIYNAGPGFNGSVPPSVLTVINSTISSNAAEGGSGSPASSGGGIKNAGTALVAGCTFTGNSVSGDGGGGIENDDTMTVSNCTFYANAVANPGGILVAGGGGIDNEGPLSLPATLTVVACTIAGNVAPYGGGLYTRGPIGPPYNLPGASTLLLNTIVAGNGATTAGPDVYGALVAGSANNLLGGNAGLAPLANYGGPTPTMALLPGSPALGAGGALSSLAVGTDAGATTITLAPLPIATGTVPNDAIIWIDAEELLVTGVSNRNLTVVRGYNGTAAAGHNAGAPLYLATDQRGVPRPGAAVQDLGALEGTAGPPPAAPFVVANAFTHSAEYYGNLVTSFYQRYLGRGPDGPGLAGWVQGMLNGLTDEQVEAFFIGSAEYIASKGAGPGNWAPWVTGMYQDLLGRTPSLTEEQPWVNYLNGGGSTSYVAYGFAASAERESDRVTADYEKYLGRAPSGAEVQQWVTAFEQGLATNEYVIAGFIGSAEYFQDHGANNVRWLEAAYQAILGRLPDAPGFAAWLAALVG